MASRQLTWLALTAIAPFAASTNGATVRWLARPELQFANVSSFVARLVSRPSDCVPPGAVLLSTTNEYHSKLRELQFSRVRDQSCLMDRLLSVCFNVSDGLGTCVPGPRVFPAEFRKSNYANLIWAKWRILADALSDAATTALWLDADVVMLRNPFDSEALWPGTGHDIRYQAEVPPSHNGSAAWRHAAADACPPLAHTNGLNGGQLLLNSGALARDMDRRRPPKLSNADLLDQDFANRLLLSGGYSRCPLPSTFASHHWGRGMPHLDPCEVVTVHTNGAGTIAGKASAMASWLKRTAHCAHVNATSDSGHHQRRKNRAAARAVRHPPPPDGASDEADAAWLQARYPDEPPAKGHAAEWVRFAQMFSPGKASASSNRSSGGY